MAHLPDWLVVVLMFIGLIVVSVPLSSLVGRWLRGLHKFYPPDDDDGEG